METDPVCKMKLEPERAAAKASYQGKTYYFCSPSCHKTFTAHPEKYVTKGEDPGRGNS